MSPTTRRPDAAAAAPALAVSLAILIAVGCTARPTGSGAAQPPGPTAARPAGGGTPAAPAAGAKPFAGWPTPAGALLISGQQDGYLEPCGCTEGQKGGLGRRLDLIGQLRARKWPLALIDLGSLAHDPATDRGGPEEAKQKFAVALRALAMMKYDALALGADDLKLGVDEALMLVINGVKDRPKVVAANLAPAEGMDTEGHFRPSLRVAAGPVKVGITAVLDPEAFRALNDPAKDVTLAFKEPARVLPAVLAALEKDTDVQVLMVQGAPEKAKAYALAHPGFDLVVATSAHPDPDKEPVPLNGGKTLLIAVGRKGQYVGVVGFFRDGGPKVRYQRVMLGPAYQQAEPIRKLLDEEMQADFRAARVVESYPRRASVGGAPGARFAGADACRSCHPQTFLKWQSTGHARAYEGLLKPGRNREADAECVSCHTTGFQYESGFRSVAGSGHLKGNQCENCHGPASRHVAEPDNAAFRRAIALTADRADRTRLCLQCHDDDNSPHFKFAEYYPKIAHKGLDRYADPKVHRGPAAPAPAARAAR